MLFPAVDKSLVEMRAVTEGGGVRDGAVGEREERRAIEQTRSERGGNSDFWPPRSKERRSKVRDLAPTTSQRHREGRLVESAAFSVLLNTVFETEPWCVGVETR